MANYWNTQASPRAISASGDIEWSVIFDGTQDVDGVAVITNNAVSNFELAVMPAGSIKGAVTLGNPVDLTPLQARTLLNVADGATANNTDSFLLARDNHTGTQLASTISDFNLAVSSNSDVTANTAKITNASHTGDVVGSTSLVISDDVVSNSKLANMDEATIKGRISSGTGDPENLSVTQVRTLLNVSDGATANNTDAFLLARANHTGNQLASTISDFATAVENNAAVLSNTAKVTNAAHTGDVVGSGVLTISDDTVSNQKLADVLTSTIKGRITPGTGDPEDLTATQARTLLNVADGATANNTDAFLLERGNHTGTQLASTISDFATNVTNNSAVLANTAKVTNATHTGDVTGSTVLSITNGAVVGAKIANNAVTNARLADAPTSTIKGRVTAGTGDPEDLTPTLVRTLLNIADGATANSTDAQLRDRATHTGTQTASTISDFATSVTNNSAVLANTAKVTNADHTGDVTGSTILTISNGAVTFAKIQNISANTIIGATTSGSPVEISCTSAGRALIDDATTADQRTTLGLAINTDVQAFATSLNVLTPLIPAADNLPYYTGASSSALTTLTSFARTLLDDTNATAARATLGIVDDEEGTFTPILRTSGSSAEPTYSVRSGFYRKQGKLVVIHIYIAASSTMTGSGSVQIHGLPFLSKTLTTFLGTLANVRTSGLTTVTNGMADATVNHNTTIVQIGTTASGQSILHTYIQNGTSFLINATYHIP